MSSKSSRAKPSARATVRIRLTRVSALEIEAAVSGEALQVMAVRRRLLPYVERQLSDGETPIYRIPVGRLRILLVDLVGLLTTEDATLERDDYVSEALDAVAVELGALHEALQGNLAARPIPTKLSGFKRPLTPKQTAAVGKLLALPHSANFSVPGAGKTAMLLAMHQIASDEGQLEGLLVVCPRNAFRPWEEEIELSFTNPPKVRRLTGGAFAIRRSLSGGQDIKRTVFLISYSQLAEAVDVIEDWLSKQPRVHIVLDESHRIKRSMGGVWGRAVHRIAPLAARRDILSGTPLPNNTIDLSGQLNWLWPYRQLIPDYVLRDDTSERVVIERLKPIYQRITKKDLDLPVARTMVQSIRMGPLQQRIHDAITDRTRRTLENLDLRDQAVLAGMARKTIRLLQVASNPSLLTLGANEFDLPPLEVASDDPLMQLLVEYQRHEVPMKFRLVLKRIKERAALGKKTIVWSMFVRNLEMMAKLLETFNPVVVHGSIPTAMETGDDTEGSREQLIERFKSDSNCMVLVANPAACGESISLHRACNYAIYIDRSFNAAHFLQSADRIHRLGLPRNAKVTYELLLSKGTVDEVVHQRLQAKTARLARILNDEGLEALALDTDDPEPDEAFSEEDATAVMEFLISSAT